jgi:cytochrome c55X
MRHRPLLPSRMPVYRSSPIHRARSRRAWTRLWLAVFGHGLAVAQAVAQGDAGLIASGSVRADREPALVRMVRHDCGACHGMRLTGGLGPALTREALAGKPLGGLAVTIFQGRPGTPMPPWRALLSEAESWWIAEQLMRGFPEERRGRQ